MSQVRSWLTLGLTAGLAITLAALAGWTVAAWGVNADNRVGNPRYTTSCANGTPGSAAGPVCRTDNAGLSYYMDSSGEFELEAEDRTIVQNVMNNRYDPTNLNVSYDSSPAFSGSSETDIIYQEGAVQSGFDGVTWCDDSSPSPVYECDQQYVRIRGAGVYSPHLACHESGHAVGLVHGTNANPQTSNTDSDLGCMRTPVPSGSPLGANQVNRINQMY